MKEFDKLVEIIKKLRHPETGCPWDLKQTHKSLIPNFIEELYECVEAIENNDFEHLSEELGDLTLHIIMQVQIAEEEEKFVLEDVLNKINDKLQRRHPHIFGDLKMSDPEIVKLNWERIKIAEKKKSRKSILEGIPSGMPALIYAQRIQEKAAAANFDWKTVEPAVEKIDEELAEFKEAMNSQNEEDMKNELGDLLFSIANVSRKLGFDAESCLRGTINKFDKRFKQIEEHLQKQNENIYETDLEKLDEIWNLTKESEKQSE
jgi:tetrapyrrole methylase family protein / MazG family protein